MIDNHVHVGWYVDGYHSPEEIWKAEQEAGIDEIAVSSTSTCAELYKLVVREMRELIYIGGSCIHPLLWLTPRMMKTWGIRYMLHSRIRWEGVKMHWKAHREWFYNRPLLMDALDVARCLQVPVLLHTGDFKECHARVFLNLCRQHEDLTFVLAHGWPIGETMEVLALCSNTYVDTAFMPVEDVMTLAHNGFTQRTLFGTDAPINQVFYKEMTTPQYIKYCLTTLKNKLPPETYEQIVSNVLYHQ
ncbi:MAG: amidohydrolase family protein [Bacteroidaceae bacterium]|nr:amidohydrolase family protein [Bacteroidaceae bacterium]